LSATAEDVAEDVAAEDVAEDVAAEDVAEDVACRQGPISRHRFDHAPALWQHRHDMPEKVRRKQTDYVG